MYTQQHQNKLISIAVNTTAVSVWWKVAYVEYYQNNRHQLQKLQCNLYSFTHIWYKTNTHYGKWTISR